MVAMEVGCHPTSSPFLPLLARARVAGEKRTTLRLSTGHTSCLHASILSLSLCADTKVSSFVFRGREDGDDTWAVMVEDVGRKLTAPSSAVWPARSGRTLAGMARGTEPSSLLA